MQNRFALLQCCFTLHVYMERSNAKNKGKIEANGEPFNSGSGKVEKEEGEREEEEEEEEEEERIKHLLA